MSSPTPEEVIVTASLSSGIARVARGLSAALALIDEVLELDHDTWESALHIGDIEFYTSKEGPYPNNQMRVSVRPSAGVAALHYSDHDDPKISDAYSYTNSPPSERVYLVFSGETGRLFPQSAVISVSHARAALSEWLRTRKRPTCIEWRAE